MNIGQFFLNALSGSIEPLVDAEFENLFACFQALVNVRPDGYVANPGSAGLLPKTTGDSGDTLKGNGTYGKVDEGGITLSPDITTNDVSTTAHGFAPQATGSQTFFLNANGAYAYPDSPNLTRTLTNRLMLGML